MRENQGNGLRHGNSFGLLRLVFAMLVIVSHSPELIDGNRSRELLTRTFGTMSFGEVAVDAFFLVSGYLISQSFARSSTPVSYMAKRIGRIVPGYVVAFTICFFGLAPLVGGTSSIFSGSDMVRAVVEMLRLLPPGVSGVLSSTPYPMLNGSMWTIAYEFRCYVAVAVCGLIFARSPRAVLALAGAVACGFAIATAGLLSGRHLPLAVESVLGEPGVTVRFDSVFGTGVLFYLLRHRIPMTRLGALLAGALLLIGMTRTGAAEPSFAVFGGYLIFYAAFHLPPWGLSRWTDRTDISYGTYLYAWPIGNTIVFFRPGVDPWLLCLITMVMAALCGIVSWTVIEKPNIRFAHRLAAHWLAPVLRSGAAASGAG